MPQKNFSILALIFFIGCSTTPVKYDKPVKVDDYKYFVSLKEKKDDTVSKKTFGQKLKEAFTTTPKSEVVKVEESKTNEVEIKKARRPKRKIRKTNTGPITNEPSVLLANTRPGDVAEKRDTGKTIMLYLIYLQAVIIAIFAYTVLRRQKKIKKTSIKTGELNL